MFFYESFSEFFETPEIDINPQMDINFSITYNESINSNDFSEKTKTIVFPEIQSKISLANTKNEYKKDVFSKKRGRISKKSDCKSLINGIKTHSKFSCDNLVTKIQVHFMDFLVDLLNEILTNLGYNEKLFKLSYKYKKRTTKKDLQRLFSSSIGDILSNPISQKYSLQKSDINRVIICKIMNKDLIIKKILLENYLNIFKKIYYKNNRTINLNEYGLDEIIILPDHIKMYKDLLKKNYNKYNNKDCDEYNKRMNEFVLRNFLSDSIFLCN